MTNPKDTKRIIISLEGNIGAGKTSLLNRIKERHARDSVVILEPVDEWTAPLDAADPGTSMLSLVYDLNSDSNACFFQAYALGTRVSQLLGALAETGHDDRAGPKLVLMERSIQTNNWIFARMMRDAGSMSPAAWKCYETWYDVAMRMIDELTGGAQLTMVYLRASPDVCFERMKTRARHEEHAVDIAYLHELHERHERMVADIRAAGTMRLIEVDGDGPVDDSVIDLLLRDLQ